MDPTVVATIYVDYEGTTWYMQMMLNELFAITGAGQTCTPAMLPQAQQNIIDVQEGAYQTQLSMLSPKQKLVLQAIAHEGTVKSATSGAFIKKYSLDSASSVQSAIRGLHDKEIISNTGNGTKIYDYFFACWLKKNY